MRLPIETHTKRLSILKKFYYRLRRFPTYEEMLKLFHLSSKNAIFRIVSGWIKRGIVNKDADGRLVPTDDFFSLPLLGSIKAGSPTQEEETAQESISLHDHILNNADNTYLLRVSGDSMICEGIKPGDMVVLDRSREPKDGDIVAAHIDSAWTLKYFRRDKTGVRLVAANPAYSPIVPRNTLEIGGVVVSVIRKYY